MRKLVIKEIIKEYLKDPVVFPYDIQGEYESEWNVWLRSLEESNDQIHLPELEEKLHKLSDEVLLRIFKMQMICYSF